MFKIGDYMACWNNPNCLDSVCGRVTDVKVIDKNNVSYTIEQSDGSTTTIIDNGKNRVQDYSIYSTHLRMEALDYIAFIEHIKEFLKQFLGDEYSKAREIADKCKNRYEILREYETVIIYPVDGMLNKVDEYKEASVLRVSFSFDQRGEQYCSEAGFKKSCFLPVYDVIDTEGNYHTITGHGYGANGWFMGTREEFIRRMVEMTDALIDGIVSIDELRKKLYDEVKDTGLDNIERAKMTFKIEIPEPIASEKEKTN